MKRICVVALSIIMIVATSVIAFATSADFAIIDTITNLQFSSQNCVIVKYNTATPTPSMCDSTGAYKAQKTTYNVLYSLYETVTKDGASFYHNNLAPGIFHWYEYGGYCWIKFDADENTNTYWVGNYSGKVLYCDAPVTEDSYTISAIAGATGYCQTTRPAGTTGGGYLGDMVVSQDNLTTIHGVVSNLGGAADYYTVLRIVNGEYRYYIMCTYPNRTQYFVCNTSGQLYYALRDEVVDNGSTGSGSVFDATETIAAINSVYDAVVSMSSNIGSRLANLINATNGIGASVESLSTNVVTGFTGLQDQLGTLVGYFEDLSGLFPVEQTITLSGTDTRVAWDAADRITDVKLSGINSDLIVKEHAGDLVNESGYEKVSLSDADTEYKLTTDDSGYRRITADVEYPPSGPAIPENAIFYFPFEESLSSSVGDYTFTANGSYSFADGIDGKAVKFDSGTTKLNYSGTGNFGNSVSSCTFGFWLYIPNVTSSSFYYTFNCGLGSQQAIIASIRQSNRVEYTIKTSANTQVLTTGNVVANGWNYISLCVTGNKVYLFTNGNLDYTYTWPSTFTIAPSMYLQLGGSGFEKIPVGSMVDNFMYVGGDALWTSSFDPFEDAIFSEVAADYFLPCASQGVTLNFNNEFSVPFSPTDVLGNPIAMGRMIDDVSYIYRDTEDSLWKCHDVQTQNELVLSAENQAILNDTIYIRQTYTAHSPDSLTPDMMQSLLPVDGVVYLDISDGGSITITYDHYAKWFRTMYLLMDKQNQLLSNMGGIEQTIINVENTVVDITQDNDAFNIFYIEKTDGTTESVGETATDAAKIVGDMLSVFYRLIFADGLANAEIIGEFEEVYTVSNTGVNVW